METPCAEQTVFSVLTPSGRGAVAVIAAKGPDATSLVGRFFRAKAGRFGELDVNRLAYGRWGIEPAEDVIACRRASDIIEIHCHGGAAAVKRIVEDVTTAGASVEPWPTWLERHEMSPIRAAACLELSQAATERTSLILLDQYHGALDAAVDQIVQHLADGRHEAAKTIVNRLLSLAPIGMHLTLPWRVVIVGPPNVGKSSLINALVGYERAIVFDQPGTTRDVVTVQTALAGWPVQLADTAGLRTGDDPLESAGIERAVAQAAAADCMVLLFDASQPWSDDNDQLIRDWPNALVVHNKCDLSAPKSSGLAISALAGIGIDALIQSIVARLVPRVPIVGEAVPFTEPQVQSLRTAAETLMQGHESAAIATLKQISKPIGVADGNPANNYN